MGYTGPNITRGGGFISKIYLCLPSTEISVEPSFHEGGEGGLVEIIQELVVVDHVESFRQVHLVHNCSVWRFGFVKPFHYIKVEDV